MANFFPITTCKSTILTSFKISPSLPPTEVSCFTNPEACNVNENCVEISTDEFSCECPDEGFQVVDGVCVGEFGC